MLLQVPVFADKIFTPIWELTLLENMAFLIHAVQISSHMLLLEFLYLTVFLSKNVSFLLFRYILAVVR